MAEGYKAVGKINSLAILGIDAYGVAVKQGYTGTVEEWLESLKGEPGKSGIDTPEWAEMVQRISGIEGSVAEIIADLKKVAKVSEVTLYAANWEGSNGLYSQIVAVEGVTERSQVDLTPNVDQLVIFHDKDLTFVTENEDGVVTVYAIGQKPTSDYTIQVTLTEVMT